MGWSWVDWALRASQSEEHLGRVWLEARGRCSELDSVKRRSHTGSCICRCEAGDILWDLFSLLMVLRWWEWMRRLGEKKNFKVWAWTPLCGEVERRRQEQSRLRGATDRVGESQEAEKSDVQNAVGPVRQLSPVSSPFWREVWWGRWGKCSRWRVIISPTRTMCMPTHHNVRTGMTCQCMFYNRNMFKLQYMQLLECWDISKKHCKSGTGNETVGHQVICSMIPLTMGGCAI